MKQIKNIRITRNLRITTTRRTHVPLSKIYSCIVLKNIRVVMVSIYTEEHKS